MATPHMAGEAALLRQYLNKNYPNITAKIWATLSTACS